MRPLYEINNEITACVDAETGEIVDAERLDALVMEREKKIEAVALWYKDLKAERDAVKEEAKSFAERVKSLERTIDSLQYYLSNACEGEPFSTSKCKISFRKSKYVDIAEDAVLPDSCLEYQPPKVNKKAVKDLLGMGFEIKGASIKERTKISIK